MPRVFDWFIFTFDNALSNIPNALLLAEAHSYYCQSSYYSVCGGISIFHTTINKPLSSSFVYVRGIIELAVCPIHLPSILTAGHRFVQTAA